MPSATADTNIYISALQFGGLPRRFLDLARAEPCGSTYRTNSWLRCCAFCEKSSSIRPKLLQDVEAKLTSITHRVKPEATLNVIQADPSDNRILECAAAAKSDYIVTGDARHILPLGSHDGIPIVKVAEFLRQLQASQQRS